MEPPDEAAPRPVILVVSDVVTPSLSGPKLGRRLLAAGNTAPVPFMSAYPEINFIQKPFAPEALARKAREVLDRGLEKAA